MTRHDVPVFPVRSESYAEGQTLPAIAPTGTTPGSKGQSPAHFVPGQASLIASDPTVKCRRFDGGHVRVTVQPGVNLYTDQFTLEAWIRADAFDADFEYGRADQRIGAAAPKPIHDLLLFLRWNPAMKQLASERMQAFTP